MPAPRVLARAAGFAVVAALLLSAPVSAAVPSSLTATGHGMVATVSGLKLVSNAAVSVQISYTCDPIDENGTLVSAVFGGGSVTVSQAVGKTIAQGTISFGGPANCDSSTVNHMSALVISATVPFKTGASVIQTFIQASDDNFCCQGDYFRRANRPGGDQDRRWRHHCALHAHHDGSRHDLHRGWGEARYPGRRQCRHVLHMRSHRRERHPGQRAHR